MNFIICEDEQILANHYIKLINNYMMNYDIEYKIHLYDRYGNNFKNKISKINGNKIFILDIKTKEGSGVTATKEIREELDDWNSMIIIITSYTEYKYELIGKRLMVLDFINKNNNPDKRLKEDLNICMKNLDNKQNSLNFKYKGLVRVINYKDIVSIEKEQDSKRCIINTKDNKYYIQGTLNNIKKKLDNRFIKTHRSLLVNVDYIDYFKQSTNELFFKNKDKTYLVSRTGRKEVTKNARVVE